MKRYLFCSSIASVCIAVNVAAQLAVPAHAQSLASINGVARLGRAPVAEVSIMLRSLLDDTTRVVLSGPDGSFRVSDLNPGSYELSAIKEVAGW